MRMMPRATPRHANVYVHLAHVDGPNGAGVTSNSVRRTAVESNMKANIFYTWLVKTLHNVLSSFAISLVLFFLLGLGFFLYIAFCFSVSPTVGCVQHLTPQNMYIAEDQPHCPPHSPLSRNAVLPCPLVSILCPACTRLHHHACDT